ncbi:MAG: hypothetical protein M1832_004944 [Thelocarpon impressellum]|nr:MAG: hypothetical protein M1832_004944 [Thelocarpon impressellum]
MYRPDSLWTWAFAGIAFVQAAVVLGLEGYVFAVFQEGLRPGATAQPQDRTIPTYLTLFIFGFVYQLVLVWDALRLKNTIQIICLCLYNLCLLIYAAVQINQIRDSVFDLSNPIGRPSSVDPKSNIWRDSKPFLVAIPCVIALGTILLSLVAWKLYDEFAWTIYKHISADLRMKRRFLTFQIYIALLKFDFFFFLGFTVQFVVIVLPSAEDREFGLTIAAIPVTILILVMAAYWTRREIKPGMFLIIALYFAALGYFIFKLVRIYEPGYKEKYAPAARSLTTFGVITVILIVITIVNACVCTHNFGKGLKPHISSRKTVQDEEKVTMTEMPSYSHQGPVPSRMTID